MADPAVTRATVVSGGGRGNEVFRRRCPEPTGCVRPLSGAPWKQEFPEVIVMTAMHTAVGWHVELEFEEDDRHTRAVALVRLPLSLIHI